MSQPPSGRGSTSISELRSVAALAFVDDLEAPQLDPETEHHLLDVLRLADGTTVAISDGAGSWQACRLEREHRSRAPGRSAAAAGRAEAGGRSPVAGRAEAGGRVTLVPLGKVRTVPPSSPPIGVGFALTKGDRPEWTVQKLTEIGVDRIVPLFTERTIVRIEGAALDQRVERYRRIAREAGTQSRRLRLPRIAAPLPLLQFIASLGAASAGVALAEPGGMPLDDRTRTVLVGPEGGFSERELAGTERHVGLGPTVLRAETAALVAGALLVAKRSERLSARFTMPTCENPVPYPENSAP
ncbi:MAG TPA: RsmE family RNA methyltransferase [Acidimicrobiales bacterium]|nr:RsmE family RNA methyltransferase [Acidimicrobiales bacterium]